LQSTINLVDNQLISVSRDITAYRLAQTKLQESHDKFDSLFSAMSAGVVFCKAVYDKNKNMTDSIFIDMNQAYEGFTNLKKETAIGKKVSELLPGTESEWFSTLGEVVKTGKPISFEMYHDQSQIYYSVFAYNSNKDEFVAVFENITERMAAIEALKESESKFRTVVTENEEIIFMLEKDGTISLSEGKGLKELGLKPGQTVGMSIFEMYKDYPKILEEIRKALQGERKSSETEIDGIYFRNWYTPRYNAEGEVIGVLGMSANITEQKQSEKALIESERRLSALMANLPGMAYRCINDEDWTMEFVSEGCLGLTEYPSADLIGNKEVTYAQLIHPEDQNLVWDKVQEALKEKRSFELEYRILTANGSLKHVWEKGLGIFDGGRLLFLEGFITDITESKQAQNEVLAQKQRLGDIIEATNVGTWEWNVQTGETIFNKRWAQIIGYTLEELAPINIDTWIKYVHPDDAEESGRLLEEHFCGKTDYYRCEARMRHKNGEWIWILDVGKVVSWTKDGKPLMMSGTHQDITERKKLWNELVISKEKAEESDRLKSAFLATMNHELRTPLNHILGLSSLIPDMTDDEEIKEFSNLINKSGTNLLNIIEDIFDLSMIEQTEITIRENEVCIRDLYVELKRQLQETLYESQKTDSINLGYKINSSLVSKRILIDKTKVMQVMLNLIKNAVKYTAQGNIGLEVSMLDKDFLLLSIKDTGIGISKEKQQIIFEFFRQGDDSDTRQHDGVGIGLAIAQKIAHAVQGQILLESELGVGSIFTFKLPIQSFIDEDQEFQDAIEKQSVKDHLDLNGKQILIVEDDKISLDMVSKILSVSNCEILKAYNGKESLDVFADNPGIDLILMDIKMPVMDGLRATIEIRKANKDIPIIAMTAYSLLKDKKNALNAGCNDVITKPVNPSIIMNKLNKYLVQ